MKLKIFFFNRFHVTNVITEKNFKTDGNVKLCFEESVCTEVLEFFDLPINYGNCSEIGRYMPETEFYCLSIS